jgi:glycosyltransferase involved in cell wall biosynthesis
LVRYCIEGGWPKERVFHIPNFPNLEEGVAVERATLATPNHVPLALAMGRLHPNKAHDVLIRAAALIPDLWVWIAGEGPERANLGGLVRELGLESRVKFLGWRTDRAGLFKAVDLCVYPSRKEPFGNVVVEAWGYGVPLVTAASTGPAWLARDGEDALLTPVDDANALAEAIKKVIGSRALAQTLAENGRRRVAAAFSESVIVRQYLDLFETVRPQTSRFRTRREGRLCGL